MSNEDFWQCKIKRITTERDELADNLRDMAAHAEQLRTMLAALPSCRCEMSHDEQCELARQNAQLRNVLQTLCDLQNGAPLLRYADEWQAAMDEARRLLVTQEDGTA